MAGKGPRGMLSVAQLREVAEGRVETVVVGFTDMYGRLMGKRFDAEFFLETCVRPGGARTPATTSWPWTSTWSR